MSKIRMTDTNKKCFTCRKSDCNKLYNVQSSDSDKITYLDKLKTCITSDLIEEDTMEMCGLCIKHLSLSYKFRLTVLMSQEILRRNNEIEDVKNNVLCENIKVLIENNDYLDYVKPETAYLDCVKLESGSDEEEFVKNEIISSDNLSDRIDAFANNLEKKRTKRKYQAKIKSQETYNCEYCGAHFEKNWQLRKHLARVHNEIRKFMCTYCGKEFKQSYHLKEHITSHTGEKNYTCPICDKKFQRLSSQRRHIKSHEAPPGHKTKRTPFLCTICGKSFPFSNGVQRHMRIHLGIKNFECKMCSRKFTQSTHLQVHMRTHTGEKPYICDTCGEKFSLKSCMLKHINNRHFRTKTVGEEIPLYYLSEQT